MVELIDCRQFTFCNGAPLLIGGDSEKRVGIHVACSETICQRDSTPSFNGSEREKHKQHRNSPDPGRSSGYHRGGRPGNGREIIAEFELRGKRSVHR
jgi:hypothetical protein